MHSMYPLLPSSPATAYLPTGLGLATSAGFHTISSWENPQEVASPKDRGTLLTMATGITGFAVAKQYGNSGPNCVVS